MGSHYLSLAVFLMPVLLPYVHTLHIFGLIGKKQPLEKIQNNALIFFFGLGTAAPLAALLGDSGWSPIQLHLQFTMLKNWFRVCSMSSERVPKQAFLWSCSLSDSGKVRWASHASDLLDRLDLHIFSPDGLQSNKFMTACGMHWPTELVSSR